MKFGPLPVAEAEGAILAHSARLPGRVIKKGTRLSAEDVAAFAAAGIAQVTALRLDPGDVPEDAAAAEIAAALTGPGVRIGEAFTGRANLFSETRGLIVYDRDGIDRLNLVNEAVTVAALPAYDVAEVDQMIATIKIIPFAVSRAVLDAVLAVTRTGAPLITVVPFQSKRIGLILTRLPGMKESILDKTVATARERIERYGSEIVHVERTAHDQAEVVAAIERTREQGVDIVLIFGASAVVDRKDVLPAAVVEAGGVVHHFGMPVDPGNLLFIGELADGLDTLPVVGMPGCARSPKLNGFDWVLWRLLADLQVTKRDIMLMGAGGLLIEIAERGQPRAPEDKKAKRSKPATGAPRIAALILAAGSASRMGSNKMTADVAGTPMVRRVADAVAASKAKPVVVVTGNEPDMVIAALAGIDATVVHNPDFTRGMSTSLKAGIAALPANVDGVIVTLGDMPLVRAADIDRLIRAFDPVEGRAICVPVHNGRRGNPVLWGKQFFAEMQTIAGDQGARALIEEHADQVIEVAMEGDGVLVDVDTPDKLAEVRSRV
jgi:molybdenum cofactor cytidylyltransferase